MSQIDAPVYCTKCGRKLKLLSEISGYDSQTGSPVVVAYRNCKRKAYGFIKIEHDEWRQREDGEWEEIVWWYSG